MKIENCTHNDFEFRCPNQWAELKPTYVEGIRGCVVCKKNVYWCRSPAEVKLHVSVDHCIAISAETYDELRAIDEAAERQKAAYLADLRERVNAPDTRLPFVGVWRRDPNK